MPDLTRFRTAQDAIWPAPLAELQAGRKTSHWMWFVFPQLKGLGRSATAEHYGIDGLAEARDYLADTVLGLRLSDTTRAMLAHEEQTAESILGPVDALKLRSSATLFCAAGGGAEFQQVLDAFCGGVPCAATLGRLGGP